MHYATVTMTDNARHVSAELRRRHRGLLMLGQAAQVAIWVALIAVVIAPFWVEHRATTHRWCSA